jgi:polyisoprenyl-phosphate glycosyltransferase
MNQGRSLRLSLVVPALGEADNLRLLLPSLLQLADSTGELEIVVVDDHSSDGTFAVVRDTAARDRRVRGLRLARNSGSHMAILCGLHAARGDAAVVLAADGQDPPEVVHELISRWQSGAQIVWAVRQGRENASISTRLSSRLFFWLMNHVTSVRLPPAGTDFFLVDRRVLDALASIPEHRVSLFALISSLGFRQEQVEYTKRARRAGKSKWTLRKKIRILLDSVIGFSLLPLRLATAFGLLYAVGGFIYAALIAANMLTHGRVFGGVPFSGYSALMTVLMVSSGTIMVMLGIFGEYLGRALEELRGRPRFLIEDSVNLEREQSLDGLVDQPRASAELCR